VVFCFAKPEDADGLPGALVGSYFELTSGLTEHFLLARGFSAEMRRITWRFRAQRCGASKTVACRCHQPIDIQLPTPIRRNDSLRYKNSLS
jgi:hypothetical protein